MKVAHISQTDGGAGAGRAAYRIHRTLLASGVDSSMFVSNKRTQDDSVIAVGGGLREKLTEYLEAKYATWVASPNAGHFSPAKFGHFAPARHAHIRAADVVQLYWINGAYMKPEHLTGLTQPIIWRLSDVWPFTGGCHYPGSCERFTQHCGTCPQLARPSPQDLSWQLMQRKRKAWERLNLTIATPSHWMADLARKSSLFADRRVEVIPTGVDITAYQPRDRMAARARWNIPQDKIVLLFGAMDPADKRKGFAQLKDALHRLADTRFKDQLLAVVFGGGSPTDTPLPIPAMFLGRLSEDDALADAYSLADMVIVPSLEDNLPNVALEAIACGTPVVGFDVCGMKDIVRTGMNGALAATVDAAALAAQIEQLLEGGNLAAMRANAREFAVERFSLDVQAQSYLALYHDVLAKK